MPAKIAPKNTNWKTALPPLFVLEELAATSVEITGSKPSHGAAETTRESAPNVENARFQGTERAVGDGVPDGLHQLKCP